MVRPFLCEFSIIIFNVIIRINVFKGDMMNIWITRHGQTDLNKRNLMQGLTDAPLNEKGIEQAKTARASMGDVKFDAVFASPLQRAIQTAEIIGNVDRDQIIIDQRIIEVDFGKYEQKHVARLGRSMSLYWLFPERYEAPETVESLTSMIQRSRNFLQDVEKNNYENVLVVCHGGIIRTLCGYLEDKPNGIKWRPKPENCEIRVYESIDGKHRFIKKF